MYYLTLTHAERRAIDFVGHRYTHGDDLFHELIKCEEKGKESTWDAPYGLTFAIPENVAWNIRDLLADSQFECLAPSFASKLQRFIDQII